MGGEREAALLSKLEAAEKERDKYKLAYRLWCEKTEWVQEGINSGAISPKYLGWHRADVVSDLLKKAEKERDALRTELKETWHRAAAAENTIKSLQAKIERMEKQEPVAWLHESRRDSDVVTNAVKHVWGKAAVGSMAAYSIPLYTLPGAKGEYK
jgi:chromosome segregation ATPase